MDELGLIREHLDIKILILYVLARLTVPVDRDALADIVFCDGGVDYFSFSACLAELVGTGHIADSGGTYAITQQGRMDGALMETGLPLSVRTRAQEAIGSVMERTERAALVRADHTLQPQGCVVELRFSDGEGPLLHLTAQVGGEAQARKIEENFKAQAEALYVRIVELLTGE